VEYKMMTQLIQNSIQRLIRKGNAVGLYHFGSTFVFVGQYL
jgi:hypothetical protein